MSNAPAFLIDSFGASNSALGDESLPPEVVKHLKALRVREGEEVIFLDGQGRRAYARRNAGGRFTIEKIVQLDRPHPFVELCLAAPKGDALWEAVTQATEVGVSSLRLIKADHVQAPKKDAAFFSRIQRVSDSACEQCLQPWRVQGPSKWEDLEDLLNDTSFLHLHADEALSTKGVYGFTQKPQGSHEKIRLYIGPEGGWSERERQVFGAHAVPFGLGPLILRVPTACVAALQQIRWLYASR